MKRVETIRAFEYSYRRPSLGLSTDDLGRNLLCKTPTQQYKLWSSRPRPLKACDKNRTLEWER